MRRSSGFVRHGWKLLALVLAFLFWRSVLGERKLIRELEVPITLTRLSPDLALAGDRPTTLKVRVTATEPVIKSLTPSDIEANVDLAGSTEGPRVVTLRPEQLRAPYGVEIIEISPELMRFTLERKTRALVRVDCQLLGKLAEGHELKRVEATPSEVEVEGPQSAVRAVQHASTAPINIDGRSASFSQQLEVHVESPGVRLSGQRTVVVRVVIDEVEGERIFPGLPIAVSSAEFLARVRPAEVDVTAVGPESLIRSLAPEDIEVRVDLAGLEPAQQVYKLPVTVDIKPERAKSRLRVKDISAKTVDVRIFDRKLPDITETDNEGRPG